MAATLDLITIGRSSVDLYGEQTGGRLEDMGSFAKYVGGSPTNTAIGAARLGLKAALITRVGDDHFGRFIREELVRESVDVTAVGSDSARLTALAILGIRDREHFPLLFYRRDCADMALSEADIDEAFVAGARAVLISGTHLSTPGTFAAGLKAARAARAGGGKVVFDIDYRPVLWGLAPLDSGENRFVADAGVTARLREVAGLCDLIVGTEEEFLILGGEADVEAALRAVRAETPALLVCKRGPLGCVAFEGAVDRGFADGIARRGVDIEVFNVLGAGDAFMAGFLRGWLRGKPAATCCDFANACGAIVVSRHGCAPAMPTWPELDHFLEHGSPTRRLREDPVLENIHWATTRRPELPELCVLAPAATSAVAAVDALDRLAAGRPGVGVALPEGALDALERTAETALWVGRPIALEGSDPAIALREWPLAQVAMAVVDDPDRQTDALRRLFAATRATRRELLLELPAPAAWATSIEAVYALGVTPDWWLLASADSAAWAAARAAIEAGDARCRGALARIEAPAAHIAANGAKGFLLAGGDADAFQRALASWRAAPARSAAE
jgi:5-dehydro-2-deoxygluconokinase